jgi:nucleoid DNA-binding protein
MIPKKSKVLYKEVAEELNLSLELVEDFVEFYYKEIKSNITNLTHPRINVECLGQFVIRPAAVRKAIPRYKKAIENHDTSTFNAYYNKVNLEKKIVELESMAKELDKIDLKKEKIKAQKEKYNNDILNQTKDESSIKNNLGE